MINNEKTFQPPATRIKIELFFPFLCGVFFTWGYFSDSVKINLIEKTLAIIMAAGFFLMVLRAMLFTPSLIKISESKIIFKKMIPLISREIPQREITKIHVQWRPDTLWTSAYNRPHPLHSITIHTYENGRNKAYYLFMFIWETEAKINHGLVDAIRKTPLLKGKVVETTKSRLSLIWS